VELYRRALCASPDHPPSLYNLGACLRELNQREEAEACLRRVAALDPADADALYQLGCLLYDEARYADAAGVLRSASVLWPQNPMLFFHLGIALARSGDPWQAIGCFREALALEPVFPDAQFNLGNAYSLLNEREQAIACYQEAVRAQPDDPLYRSSLLNEKQHACDWSQLAVLVDLQRQSVAQQPAQPIHPFYLLSIPSTRAEQLQCGRNFAAHQLTALQHERKRLSFRFDRDPQPGKIRLGYLSSDFHEHATAYLTAGLFELHDRNRFETIAYSCGPEVDSPMRGRLRRAFDRFVDLKALSNSAAAASIHADKVHILVDMKGYTTDARTEIAALRPAPIQVSFIGFPGTMGAPFIDYLVADRFLVPQEHEADYSEKLVLMPGSYQVNDRQRQVLEPPPRPALGLPEGAFVFCCFNQPYKILPETFRVWMRLLEAVPNAVLWLLESNPAATRNLRVAAQQAGLGAERLVFAPALDHSRHLARLTAADLFLDTFPCNAHTTASDALRSGLPVLTCAGDTFASRVAGSLLSAIGLPELITFSMPDYERCALDLAKAPAALRLLRERLRENRLTTPLFDTPRYVRHLEDAYHQMMAVYAAAGAPKRIDLTVTPQCSGAS